MTRRVVFSFALACSALALAGCGARSEAPRKAAPPSAGQEQVTLHVAGMTERLKLT